MDESDSAVFNQKEGALIESRIKNQEPRAKSQESRARTGVRTTEFRFCLLVNTSSILTELELNHPNFGKAEDIGCFSFGILFVVR